MQLEDLFADDDRGQQALDGVSLEIRAGEILGIAGVQGNGQRELVESLTGLRELTGGRVYLDGQDITGFSPRQVTTSGVAHIPEDREKHGLGMAYSIADNMVLNHYFERPFSRRLVINHDAVRRNGEQLVE